MIEISFLQNILDDVVAFLPNVGLCIAIYLVAHWVSIWAARLVRRGMQRRNHDTEAIVLLEMLTRWGIMALGIVSALNALAPGTFGSLIAGLGIAGFTIGFALQDVAKNFISGVLLLIQQPFDIGDEIEVSGYGGKVLEISLRATDIRAWDGRHVIIPNSDVFTNPIVNYSRAKRRRIEIVVGVATNSDLDRVARVALATITSSVTGILSEPAPAISFTQFGSSTIDFKAHYWIDTDEIGFLKAQDEGIRAIKEAFEREQIDMPYPTHRIFTAPSA